MIRKETMNTKGVIQKEREGTNTKSMIREDREGTPALTMKEHPLLLAAKLKDIPV